MERERSNEMSAYFKLLATSFGDATGPQHNVFDQRSSERLVRDEVLVRAARDPDAALIDAIRKNAEDKNTEENKNF
jgi:hypothetical protein